MVKARVLLGLFIALNLGSVLQAGCPPLSGGNSCSSGIRGTVTNDSAAAGNVGEYIESVVGVTNVPTSTQFGDLTSIVLTAGDWDVQALLHAVVNGASWALISIGVSTHSGNDQTGLVVGSNSFQNVFSATSTQPQQVPLYINSYRVSLSATTTIYLKFSSTYSGGTPVCYGRLSARRVR